MLEKLPPVVCGGTWGRRRRQCLRLSVLALFTALAVPMVLRVLLGNPNAYFRSRPTADCLAQLTFLQQNVDWLTANPKWLPPAHVPGDLTATEWPLFSLSFLSFAAYELAQQDSHLTDRAAKLIGDCLEEALRERTYGFVLADWGDPFNEEATLDGNMLYLGHLNLMLARYRELTGNARYDTLFHRLSVALHRNLQRSPTHNVNSYPGSCWPSDQVIPLVSLLVHDRLFDTEYRFAAYDWVDWMRLNCDGETGLFPAMIQAETGQHLQRPRGCALGWAIPFLYEIDGRFAQEQYRLLRKHLYARLGGLGAFREWPRGHRGFSDVDTGRVVFGIGASASGFGLAAAKAAGDRQTFGEVLKAAEIVGMPLSLFGRQAYLTSPQVGDAVLLWAKALAPRAPLTAAYRNHGGWRLMYGCLAGAGLAALLSILWGAMQRARTGLLVCRYMRDGQLGKAARAVQSMRAGRLSPLHQRTEEELHLFVTRAVTLSAAVRQEWVRKSDVIGLVFGTLAGVGLVLTFGVLSGLRAHLGWYLITLLLAYFILGTIERWLDNRIWRRLVQTVA